MLAERDTGERPTAGPPRALEVSCHRGQSPCDLRRSHEPPPPVYGLPDADPPRTDRPRLFFDLHGPDRQYGSLRSRTDAALTAHSAGMHFRSPLHRTRPREITIPGNAGSPVTGQHTADTLPGVRTAKPATSSGLPGRARTSHLRLQRKARPPVPERGLADRAENRSRPADWALCSRVIVATRRRCVATLLIH